MAVDAPPDMPLLWALRETLGLTGTKYGCGIAACGACTVHIDGAPTRSCSLPVEAAVGSEITTIEGMSGKPAKAVQAAWQKLDVVQCGYCQSGQIMAATRAPGREPQAQRRRHQRGDVRQHLSLRHVPADPRRHARRRQADGGMSHAGDKQLLPRPSRRGFLVGSAAAGLTLGFSPLLGRIASAAEAGPNPFEAYL